MLGAFEAFVEMHKCAIPVLMLEFSVVDRPAVNSINSNSFGATGRLAGGRSNLARIALRDSVMLV